MAILHLITVLLSPIYALGAFLALLVGFIAAGSYINDHAHNPALLAVAGLSAAYLVCGYLVYWRFPKVFRRTLSKQVAAAIRCRDIQPGIEAYDCRWGRAYLGLDSGKREGLYMAYNDIEPRLFKLEDIERYERRPTRNAVHFSFLFSDASSRLITIAVPKSAAGEFELRVRQALAW